tara:strand:- start:551 stop:1117 length:567 start_codon:yes stop_codon:yes gene_type:complete
MTVNEFCTWIRGIRDEKISRKEFARRHQEWHENTLKSYEKDRLPDIDYLYVLHKVTGFSLRDLIEERTRIVLSNVASPEEIEEAIAIAANSAGLSALQCIEIKDNAMEPFIQNGARCKVDQDDKKLTPGRIYCFKFEDSFTCRKVHKTLLGDIILNAESDAHLSLELSDNDREKLDIVGRVVEASNSF